MQKEVLEEIRCRQCGKLLAKGQASVMEFKCPRCGAYTILRAARPHSEPHDEPSGSKHC
ncbi:Com family DNA-binding transcriptional regulator [uncultured Desulfovibrio sp.]|uniref:Com family DNA-binding transcriptional regulator n=1 Tax=uncultured Desulfovibrio sp. TaxID=167968 RepID=UPI00261899BF|nr:Com family DNA-binding transcriptional regulator [uncultured Desulfovibrio sp.]